MADDPILSDTAALQGRFDPAGRFAERWSRLDPGEKALVALALTEMHAGTFTSWASWERFVDAALDLLPALNNGTISAAELHEVAMRHAFEDHDDG